MSRTAALSECRNFPLTTTPKKAMAPLGPLDGQVPERCHVDMTRILQSSPAMEAGSREAEVPAALVEELSQWRREVCSSCGASAMFYCPYCCLPVGVPAGVTVPRARLPFARCDIIFDDAPKKATSIHAKVLAPEQVRLIDLFTAEGNSNRTLSRPGGAASKAETDKDASTGGDSLDLSVLREIPEYDPHITLVLFPDDSSATFEEVASQNGFGPPECITLVVIDSPWKRAQVLRKHPRLANLQSIRLGHPPSSRFWRYHSEGTGCVSTVEALAALAKEVRSQGGSCVEREGDAPGLDPLMDDPFLFFFVRQFAYISKRCLSGAERPMDATAKQRRMEQVRQKDRSKRPKLRPYGPEADDHPDGPERLKACLVGHRLDSPGRAGLVIYGLWPWLHPVLLRSAIDEELQLVHPKAQIAGLKRAQRAAAELPKGSKGRERIAKADLPVQRGKKHDTFVTSSSLDAARCAAGGWVDGHLFAEGFYPSSGAPHEVGSGHGQGYTINVALPEGYTDACLLRACQDVLLPAARRFKPDLILVSAGFDASQWDPLGEANCTAEGFGRLARLLAGLARKLCQGRLLLGLEGGYDAAALASCIGEVATNLLDAADDSSSGSLQGMLEACRSSQEPLAESVKAIWATRMAHQTLPLRLMDGSSAALVPFSRTKRKYDASKNLNAETLLGQLKSKRLRETAMRNVPGNKDTGLGAGDAMVGVWFIEGQLNIFTRPLASAELEWRMATASLP
eukprot:s79_g24.t1